MTKRIEVRSQAEFDACVADGNVAIVIGCSVVARGNSSVVAWGNSSVVARGNSSVEAWGNSSVDARENSSVVARENSSVVAWGNSSVEARENSSVEARENSSVVAWGNSSVEARENSSVEARENSSVEAWENSSVVARENSSVEAWENSSVEAWGHVFIRLFKAMRIRASVGVIIARHDDAEAEIKGDATIIERNRPTTAEEWCAYHGVEVNDGVATLYKGVNDTFKSDHGFDYTPGTIPVAPDWDGGKRECGGGLHYSPLPMMTKEFVSNATKFVACPVAITDMRAPHPEDDYPRKIKARGSCAPCWECDKYGNPIVKD